MATVNKDFKIKQGLVVEGTTGTIGGNNILTEGGSDQYIIDLIGGETLITSVDSADLAVTGGELAISGSSDLARTGDIANAIADALAVNGDIAAAIEAAVPDTTDDLTEGTTNKYFSNALARQAFYFGDGIILNNQNTIEVQIASETGLQIVSGELDLDRTVIDGWYDASGAASNALADAQSYADEAASNAQSAAYGYAQDAVDNAVAEANDYTDNAVATKQDTLTTGNGIAISGSTISVDVAEISGFAFDPAYIDLGQKNNSIALPKSNLTNYTDTLYDALGAADTAYSNATSYAYDQAQDAYDNAVSYADSLASNYDAAGTATSAYNNAVAYADEVYDNAVAYTDNAVAALVDSAPDLLNTLNELAEALDNNPNVIADLQDVAAGKQDTLTAGNGIDITGSTISVDATDIASGITLVDPNYAILIDTSTTGELVILDSNITDKIAGQGIKSNKTGGHYYLDVDRTVVDGWYDASGAAANAEANAKSYADGLASNYDAAGSAANALADANSYTDSAKACAIGTAENTAWGYAQDAYDNAVAYADGLASNYDAAGAAANAQSAAESYAYTQAQNAYSNAQSYADDVAADAYANATSYTDNALSNLDLSGNYDALGAAANALIDAKSYADEAASNAQSAAESYAYGQAQDAYSNAVAYADGLDTDDVSEGANNLYFTNSRVYDAIEGANITPASVQIDTYRKEEATQQYVNTAGTVNLHLFSYPYESAKYLVRVVGFVAGTKHSQLTEILLTTDGNDNIAITEYGTIHTSANALATFSANFDAGSNEYVLTATTLVDGAEVITAATMLSWAD